MGPQSRYCLIWRIEKESVCCYFSGLVIYHKYTRGLNFYSLTLSSSSVSLDKAGADSPDIVWCSCAVGPNNTKQAQCLPLRQLQDSYLDVTMRRIWLVLSKNQQHPITLDSPLTSCLLVPGEVNDYPQHKEKKSFSKCWNDGRCFISEIMEK